VRGPSQSPVQLARDFVVNYVANADPIAETFLGDRQERHHVLHAGGNILGATFLLAAAGAFVAARRRDPWDKFLLYGVVVSLVPVSLTYGSMHMLRIVPYTAFLFALSIEGMIAAQKPLLVVAFIAALAQAAWLFHGWATESWKRETVFDCCVPPVLDAALAAHQLPIYVHGINMDPDVLWFAMLRGAGRNAFVFEQTPPPGAVGITNVHPCTGCRILAHDHLFFAYVGR